MCVHALGQDLCSLVIELIFIEVHVQIYLVHKISPQMLEFFNDALPTLFDENT